MILNADRFNLILSERHGMTYGYCRISTRKQNIERQIRNILSEFPNAVIVQEEYTGKSSTARNGISCSAPSVPVIPSSLTA